MRRRLPFAPINLFFAVVIGVGSTAGWIAARNFPIGRRYTYRGQPAEWHNRLDSIGISNRPAWDDFDRQKQYAERAADREHFKAEDEWQLAKWLAEDSHKAFDLPPPGPVVYPPDPPRPRPVWSFDFQWWIGVLLGLVLVVGWYTRLLRFERQRRRLQATEKCLSCGYQLRGVESPVCPECGRPHHLRYDDAAVARRFPSRFHP